MQKKTVELSKRKRKRLFLFLFSETLSFYCSLRLVWHFGRW